MRYVPLLQKLPLLQKSLFGLQQRLQRVHALHRRTYGRPRLHRALRDARIRISAKRVRRLMREAGIVAKGGHWAADITALPTRRGSCYLAAVLDLGSRRIVLVTRDACQIKHDHEMHAALVQSTVGALAFLVKAFEDLLILAARVFSQPRQNVSRSAS